MATPSAPVSDIADREELRVLVGEDQQPHDGDPQDGIEDVPSEEDRSRVGEHGEPAHQHVVERLDRREDDEDHEERAGPGLGQR